MKWKHTHIAAKGTPRKERRRKKNWAGRRYGVGDLPYSSNYHQTASSTLFIVQAFLALAVAVGVTVTVTVEPR